MQYVRNTDSILKRKILLVEDEAIIAMTTAKMLEKQGFEVVTAHKGEKAIEVVKQVSEISLILMDIDLGKGIDGTEAAQNILQTHDIPIVFLSSHTEPEVVEKTEGISSYGYIVKNSGETVLLASIRMAFRLFEAKMSEKKHKEALLHSHDLMSYIIEHSQSAIAVHDKELNYIYVSQQYLNQYNVSKRDVIGRHHYEVFPDLPQKWKDAHKKCLLGEVISGEDDPYDRDDGTIDWTRWECRPWYEGDGTIGGIIIYTEVITKEKRFNYDIRNNINYIQSILRTTRDGFWVLDLEGNLVDVNNAYCDMSGYSREEILQMSIPDIDADEAAEESAERMQRIISNGSEVFERRHRRKNGSIFDVEISASFFGGEDQKFICFCRDITERKHAENELINREKRYRTIVENINDALVIHDFHGIITLVNDKACQMLNYTTDELIGKSVVGLHSYAHRDLIQNVIENAAWPESEIHEIEALSKDSKIIPVEVSSRILSREGTGEIQSLVRDISERKKAEELLVQKERQYRFIYNSLRDALIIVNANREITDCNTAFTELFGYTLSEIKGKTTDIIYSSEDEYEQLGRMMQGQEENSDLLYETLYRKKNGEVFNGEKKIQYLKDNNGNPMGFVGLIRDITERKWAEEALRESKKEISSIFRSAPVGIGLVVERVLKAVNRRLCQITGYEEHELIGQSARMLYLSDDDFEFVGREKYAQIEKHGTGSVETRWKRKGGSVIYVLLSSTPVDLRNRSKGVTFTALDITGRKRMETALMESEEKHRRLFETSVQGVVYQASDGTITSANPASARILGLSLNQMIAKKVENPDWKMIREDGSTVPATEHPAVLALRTGREIGPVIRGLFHPEKKHCIWLSITAVPQYRKGETTPFQVYSVFEDITERRYKEEKLRIALEEKTFLMRELNHRIKNSLLMISSLISLKDSETEVDLSDIQHQIKAIGLIHEKLNQTENVTEISCRDYFDDLLNSIFNAFTTQRVRVEKDIDDISVSIKTALTLGLIINEIATNAIKHGFSHKEEAVFTIEMKKDKENNECDLILSNTGNSFPEEVNFRSTDTLGIRLINSLVAQIDGTIELKKKPNPVFTIRFTIEEG